MAERRMMMMGVGGRVGCGSVVGVCVVGACVGRGSDGGGILLSWGFRSGRLGCYRDATAPGAGVREEEDVWGGNGSTGLTVGENRVMIQKQ